MAIPTVPSLVTSRAEVMSFFARRNILVTGGAGFIGSNLARALVELDARVTVLDSMAPNYGGNEFNLADIRDQITFVRGDQADAGTVIPLVAGTDCIFNLVGQVSHVDSMEDPLTDLRTNVVAHISLLECLRRHQPQAKVLFAGTRGQYGRARPGPVDESVAIAPVDVNGINKHAGESYHLLYARTYGLRATSLRLANTYGPRHTMRTHRQGVLAWFVRQALDDEEIRLFGGGTQVRDCNHVSDVVSALLLSMASSVTDGEVFNLGSSSPQSLSTIAQTIVTTVGRGKVTEVPYPPHLQSIEIGDYVGDFTKAKRMFGWAPVVELEEGIADTVAYYSRHRDHYWQRGVTT